MFLFFFVFFLGGGGGLASLRDEAVVNFTLDILGNGPLEPG